MSKRFAKVLLHSHSLEEAIDQLAPDERLELIRHLARSLQKAPHTAPDNGTTPDRAREPSHEQESRFQRENLLRLLDELAALPVMSPNDGFSGRDHDAVLYGKRS